MDLFSAAPSTSASRKTTGENPTYPLDIQFEALASGLVTTGTWLRCEPEPGIFFTARVSRIDVDVNGTLSLLAPVDGHPYAFLSLSVVDQLALGEIRLPDKQRRYQIRFDPATHRHGARNLADQEMNELPPGPAVLPPLPAEKSDAPPLQKKSTVASDTPEILDAASNTTVDVMLVYTPAATTWAGGTAGINAVIAQAMSRAQACMDNSGIPITFRLIHSAQVTYTESGTSLTDLDRLQKTSDGYMDEVHTWRTQYGADIVSLLTTANDTGGLGYLLNATSGWPTYAFNLTRVQQAASSYTVIHEVGHNMGAHHHKAQNTQPGPGLYSYAAGWRWTGTNASRYCSVMTYEAGTYFADGLSHVRVGYFSNPAINHQGVATGDVADGDNARTLSNIRAVVAGYRTAPSQIFWFRAVALDDRVMLRWADPTDCGFSSPTVLVRRGTTNYPAATDQGAFVYQGSDRSFLDDDVLSGQPNYYAIWASQDGSTFVEP